MANYFDTNDVTHLSYLPDVISERDDLEALAEEAELMVKHHYTGYSLVRDYLTFEMVGYGTTVQLRHYTVDADDCTDAPFKLAFALSVARVIKSLAELKDRESGIKAESMGSRSFTYGNPDGKSSQGLYDLLRPYDMRVPPLVL